MTPDPFSLHMPALRSTPVVFSSPHSGRHYAADFLARSQLDPLTLRSSEDAFVDDLFAAAPEAGAPLLAARLPRAWIDFNRAPDELDPALVEGVARGGHNPRVASGLGVVPRVVANGRAIYPGRLTRAEVEARLHGAWTPYHAALRRLLDEAMAQFGEAVLIDCHSMPHEAIEAHARPGQSRPEVVLGDRFGAAAGRDVMERIETAFARAGLRVARNAPFAGAYIAQAYGRPSRRMHVVQVEIDRALYMDEARVERRPDFAAFRALIDGGGPHIADLRGSRHLPLAAE
ncbi:MAG TPA: N-formylglutamate amidohydrolase [Paracoccaceae bacterium]|nr:N-formylglutamate amidohydrolase [Paracoccaceae bacterium]